MDTTIVSEFPCSLHDVNVSDGEEALLQQLFESEDAQEGLDAYAKKRQAQFKGR